MPSDHQLYFLHALANLGAWGSCKRGVAPLSSGVSRFAALQSRELTEFESVAGLQRKFDTLVEGVADNRNRNSRDVRMRLDAHPRRG